MTRGGMAFDLNLIFAILRVGSLHWVIVCQDLCKSFDRRKVRTLSHFCGKEIAANGRRDRETSVFSLDAKDWSSDVFYVTSGVSQRLYRGHHQIG